MMWQLKPCMSQEFPPILQIFHCPVSLSPLHAVILLLCMCAHTDDTVLIGVRAHLEVFVERCVFAASVGASVWICCGLYLWGGFRRPRCVTVVECRRQFFSQEQQRCVRCGSPEKCSEIHGKICLSADVGQTADCCLCVAAVVVDFFVVCLKPNHESEFCLRLWSRNLHSSYNLKVSTDGFVHTSFTTWFIKHFIPEKLENLFFMSCWQYLWIYEVKKRDIQNSVSKNVWLLHVNKTAPFISL